MTPGARILVIRGGAIGDFILTLPVFAALRRQFPNASLELLGYKKTGELALATGLVEAVKSIEAQALARFFARQGELDPAMEDYFSRFALIISFLYDPDLIFQENVLRSFRGQWLAGPHRPTETGSLHATEVFLQPLERLAIFSPERQPRLSIDCADVSTNGGRYWLAVHPGSGSEQKNWAPARWVELLRRLAAETSWHFLLVGGEAEGDRLARLAECLPGNRFEMADQRPLPELARRLARCDFFIGHDSGISHLAAAVEVAGLVLWGPSNDQVWRPLHPGVQLLKPASGLNALAVEEVLKRVLELNAGKT